MKKKYIAFLLLFCMAAAVFAGCNTNPDKTVPVPAGEAPAQQTAQPGQQKSESEDKTLQPQSTETLPPATAPILPDLDLDTMMPG